MRTIEIVARLTPDAAQALWYELESRFEGGGAKPLIDLNASGVRHLSAAALQVLLVAGKRAARDGGRLEICSPSDEFRECARLMGAQSLLEETVA